MRHGKKIRKLGKSTEDRCAMLEAQTSSLLKYGKVKLTLTRAKEVKRMAEKVISLAKYGDLASRRRAARIVKNKAILKSIFAEAKARFEGRPGGFTRLTKIGVRLGDSAPMAQLELL